MPVTPSFPVKRGNCLHLYPPDPPDAAVPAPQPQAGARPETPGPHGTSGVATHHPLSLQQKEGAAGNRRENCGYNL